MGLKRDTAIFVDFGTFSAGIFSGLKRARLVPMTISGENLMFGQPPILYTPLMGTSSDRRNRPSKILELFSPPFQTLCLYTHSYPVATGTRNVQKYMPNKSSFEGRGHILMYNPPKSGPKSGNSPKNDPKISAFLALFGLIFGAIFTTFLAAAPTCYNAVQRNLNTR